MKQIYDCVRKQWVAATPEEIVRQLWLKKMIDVLGYPKELFAVEKELKTLPHLQNSRERVPERRADIMVFSAHPEHVLFPLLMIECKAISLTSQALQQVLGYNMFVGALYVAVVSKKEVLFLDGTQESNCMPSYEQLKKGIK